MNRANCSKECSYDWGDCGDCSSQCYNSDLSDGQCKEECNTEDCNWDGMDCRCSDNCPLSDLGNCNPGCLKPDCDYDEVEGYPQCTDSTLQHLAIYYHFLTQNFSSEASYESCSNTAETCTGDDLNDAMNECTGDCCKSDCNNEECAYSFGKCFEGECDGNCEVCKDEEVCLKCKPGMFQYYTSCYPSCPIGTSPNTFQFFGSSQICIPTIESSSDSDPKKYYVNLRNDGEYGLSLIHI